MPRPLQTPLALFATLATATLNPAQSTWNLVAGAGPSPRKTVAVFDELRGVGVLFGGVARHGNAWNHHGFADTWTWNGQQWSQRTPATVPMGRFHHMMAYDPIRGVVVMAGGIEWQIQSGQHVTPQDTWTWDGTNWTPMQPTALPFPRHSAAMAFDDVSGQVIMFGGAYGNIANAETWAWTGSDWVQRSPTTVPLARSGHSMVRDAIRQRIHMIGGGFRDHWEWDGTDWVLVNATAFASGHWGTGLTQDPYRDRLVRFGGNHSSTNNFTFEYDGTSWSWLSPPASPPPVQEHAMFYDGWRGQHVAFGGIKQGNVPDDDTWTYAPLTPASTLSYSPGCPGPLGVPAITVVHRPVLGQTYEISVSNLSPQSLTFVMTGWQTVSAYLNTFTSAAGPTCVLAARPDYQTFLPTNVYQIAIPNDPAFLGAALHNQALQIEVVNGNLASLSASDAVRMVMGNP